MCAFVRVCIYVCMCVYMHVNLFAFEFCCKIPKKPAAKSLEEQRAEVDVLVQGLIGPVAASQTGSRAPEKTPTKQDGSTDRGNVVEVTSK